MRRLFWLLAGAMMMAAPAAAQGLVDAGGGGVTEVTDGDTLVLEQGLVVRLGLARVYSFQDNRTMVRDLLEIKIQARTPKRGIWALAFYGIR